jgi:hypothetical protein
MAGKKEESAPQRERRRTESALNKLDKIKSKLTQKHIVATVAPQSVDYGDVGTTAHVEELLDQIIEFLGIK